MQKTLFDPLPSDCSGLTPAFRRSDPVSSKVAAAKFSQCAKSDRELILVELRRLDGQTAGELAKHLGPDWTNVRVSRRTAELKKAGVIRSAGERECKVKRSLMTEWRLVR